ncbi:MAG: DUF2061 domain-containing protein [Candidatus Bathyarchaeota archaeon]|jgi:uncharacterized membrane protein|nr:DUF2061 domain-containing protein [Candidatus Bathyarchaeota archaeon]
MPFKNIDWRESIIKSLIYRAITLLLGTITAYLITGSIRIATGTAILTEAVQSVNYFIYELIWSNISRRKMERMLMQKLKIKQVDLKIDYSSILDLAFELSQVDTFIPKVYLSTLAFFNRLLENDQLEEIHEKIEVHKERFKSVHSNRKLFFLNSEKEGI